MEKRLIYKGPLLINYVSINLDSTMEAFKTPIAEKSKVPAEQQQLIYKGRILKDDQTLESYGKCNTLDVVCYFGTTRYIVKKDASGLTVTKIENKIGLRIVQNGDILLKKVFVFYEDWLANVNSFQDANKVLAVSRVMVAWQPIGIAMSVYDMCHRYLKERKQFGVPIAAFQINQEKLVRVLGNVQAMFLIGWRLCKLYESGKMTVGQASMGKACITLRARETVALGRELLDGNGILANFLVAKAFCDLEPIFTYEGTYNINSLVTEREVTGLASFKPHPMRKQSCMSSILDTYKKEDGSSSRNMNC